MKFSTSKKAAKALGILLVGGASLQALSTSSPAMGNDSIQLSRKVFPLDIRFGDGKAMVKRGPHNKPVLDDFRRELTLYPLVHIGIEGNSDAGGSAVSNQAHSRQRAEALREIFVQIYGLPAGRIQVLAASEIDAHSGQEAVALAAPNRLVRIILYRLEPHATPPK